jgi:hypothetical protein
MQKDTTRHEMDHALARQGRSRCRPWLIGKFVDQDAEFVFAPADKVIDEAKRLGAIPYHGTADLGCVVPAIPRRRVF